MMMKQIFLATPIAVLAQVAAAEITVETYECQAGNAVQIADSVLQTYNSELEVSEYAQPSDDHILLVSNVGTGVWMTQREAQTFCETPVYATGYYCRNTGDLSVSQYVVGDKVRLSELGVDATPPAEGMVIAIDTAGAGRWTNETQTQLDDACMPQGVIELTKYLCNSDGEIETFTQNGTKEQLEAWNFLPDMPDNATGLYYNNRDTLVWSVLSPLEMAVICEASVGPEALDGTWEIAIANFDGASCPAEIINQVRAQMPTGTTTRDITWPTPWSPTPLLDDANAMGGPWSKSGESWRVTLVDVQQGGVAARVAAKLEVLNAESIAYELSIDFPAANCSADISATANWLSE